MPPGVGMLTTCLADNPVTGEVNESEPEAKSVGPELGVTDHADVYVILMPKAYVHEHLGQS